MAAPDKGKRPRLDDEQDSDLYPNRYVNLRIEQLREIQEELNKIAEEAAEKVLEVHEKFANLKRPIYDKRDELIKSIPELWLTTILSYLNSIEMNEFKGEGAGYGYSIIFHFKENPYFEDETLTKTFTFLENQIPDKITGATIKWKEGMGNANGVGITQEERSGH
ncbi:NAP1-related protein 1-like [Carica papaya]|uniref:NAP1-related protein 1-like n=1 Tax=Carica papaya TaxID=3649 RepID=UPI000B8CD34A|nr:NAP1-related protein 1-like [Carica papaya]